MNTNIYLVRHGETSWNVLRKYQGRDDSSLTYKGKEQIEYLSKHYNFDTINIIYSSPSNRALSTADILNKRINLPIISAFELLEIDLPSWSGHFIKDIEQSDPVNSYNFWNQPEEYKPSLGESFCDVQKRAVSFLESILKRHLGNNIVIVSHTIVIRSIMIYYLNREISHFWEPPILKPASLSLLKFQNMSLIESKFGIQIHENEINKINIDNLPY